MLCGQEDAFVIINKDRSLLPGRTYLPKSIRLHVLHELFSGRFRYPFGSDTDACIRKEHIKPFVLLQCFIYDTLHIGLLAGIDLSRMDVDFRV